MEPNDDPVWASRAKKLQGWLREVGPKSSAEVHRQWCKSHNTGMLTNILAYADGVYVQNIRGKWWAMPVSDKDFSKAMATVPSAPSPVECPAGSESVEDVYPEQSSDRPKQGVDDPTGKPPPPDCST